MLELLPLPSGGVFQALFVANGKRGVSRNPLEVCPGFSVFVVPAGDWLSFRWLIFREIRFPEGNPTLNPNVREEEPS